MIRTKYVFLDLKHMAYTGMYHDLSMFFAILNVFCFGSTCTGPHFGKYNVMIRYYKIAKCCVKTSFLTLRKQLSVIQTVSFITTPSASRSVFLSLPLSPPGVCFYHLAITDKAIRGFYKHTRILHTDKLCWKT